MLKSPGSCSVTANAAASFLCTCKGFQSISPKLHEALQTARQPRIHTYSHSSFLCHCLSYLQLCTLKKDLFTEKKRPEKVLANNSGDWKTAAFLQTSYVDNKLFLIKTSPVDLMQLGSKMYFLEAPESTEKNEKKSQTNPKEFRIDSITQYT